MFFPDKAGENLRDKWVQMTFNEVNTGEDYGELPPEANIDYVEPTAGEKLDDIRNEIRDRFSDFFESYPPSISTPSPELEVEAARSMDYNPEVIQEESQPPYVPEMLREANTQRSWMQGIRNLGRNLWNLLGGG